MVAVAQNIERKARNFNEMVIGVLALQGAFREHIRMLTSVGAVGVGVRLPEQLEGADGLIIPGGESTTIAKLMVEYGFPECIKAFAASGRPVFGTCAGLILLAEMVAGAGCSFQLAQYWIKMARWFR